MTLLTRVLQETLFDFEDAARSAEDPSPRCALVVKTFEHRFLTWACREVRHTDETADKLDCMMDTVFSYLARCEERSRASRSKGAHAPRSSRILAGDFEPTMHTLLRALQASLLTTYKSKFTQARLSCIAASPDLSHPPF